MLFYLKYIVVFILVLCGSGALLMSVLNISSAQVDIGGSGWVSTSASFFQVHRMTHENSSSGVIVNYTPFESGGVIDNQVLSRTFGRLSSVLFLTHSNVTSLDDVLKFNDTTSTIEANNINGIFSWYDPFRAYTLQDALGSYRITQITNGSVYVWREVGGAISVYSIDLVAELAFLSEGQEMTKIIIFPWMYIRFDPKLNAGLRNADLFRIMLALKNMDSDANTGIEFVNPRVSTAEQDVFFMYRLPKTVRPLFEFLHLSFLDRVRSINLFEDYVKVNGFQFGVSEGKTVLNPTKSEYFLLKELQVLFARVVGYGVDVEEFRSHITSIQERAKKLWSTNKVMEHLQQFLIDGRFALFLDRRNTKLQDVYNEVAKLVDITPTTGKAKLFQSLSNIFSRNLLQETTKQVVQIDNYIVAVNALKNTLTNEEMATKDYFDISLYAYLILERMTNGKIIEQKALESEVLYQLYVAIFQATQKYSDGIEDDAMRRTAQKSITLHFYDPMMTMLVRSLYSTYTQNRDGEIFIQDAWVMRDDIKFSSIFYGNLSSVLDSIQKIFNNKALTLFKDSDVKVKKSLEQNIAGLKGFLEMIRPGNYRAYQSDPYVTAWWDDLLPMYDFREKDGIVHRSTKRIAHDMPEMEKNTIDTQTQDLINISQVLSRILSFSWLDVQHIQKVDHGYLVDIQPEKIRYKFVYIPNTMSVEGIVLSIQGIPDVYITDSLPLGSFRTMLASSAHYIERIEKLYTSHSDLSEEEIKISVVKREISIGTNQFPLYD